jgi:hypothetical protein
MTKMLPPDLDAIAYNRLETCTVPNSQLFLKTLSKNEALNIMVLSAKNLLRKSKESCHDLILAKRWIASFYFHIFSAHILLEQML